MNKNQFSTPCSDFAPKKINNQFFNNLDSTSENNKIKSIPIKGQPNEIKIRRIANNKEGNWENKNQYPQRTRFKASFKEKVRSASPEYQNSIEVSDENATKSKIRRNGIPSLLAEKYKELEEIWKNNDIYNKKTIELCFEIIYCLSKYYPKFLK